MADEWRTSTLGKVCTFVAGSAFPKDYQGESIGTYPFIKVSDMNLPGNERWINYANNWISEKVAHKLRAKIHPKDAIVFAKIGIALTSNRRRLLKQPTVIDNNMMSAVPQVGVVYPLFLYYLLCTLDFNLIACGTALPYLNVSDLQRFPALVPPLKEQQAIACVLGSLDDKIELNRRMNRTLGDMARAIFKSWFVDFDPVRAKAAGQQPPGLAPHVADLFPDSSENSELGEIPRGWRVLPLGEVCELAYGKALKASERKPGEVAVMGSNGQVDGMIRRSYMARGSLLGERVTLA